MKKVRTESGRPHKGIYILPNFFTTMNVFCGFYAIVAAIGGKFEAAAVSILIAMVFDILDGKVARATQTTSRFGIEYDSLADVISFGMAPAMMMYLWALKPLGRLGWLAAFMYLACGALRLARFNSKADDAPSAYFTGLPIPAAAAMCATTVLFSLRLETVHLSPYITLAMLFVLAFLMVSTVRYHSFKKPELFKRGSFNVLVALILVFVFIALEPPIGLFAISLAYVCCGPALLARNALKLTKGKEMESQR